MSRYIDADKLKEILFITANFADLKKVFEGYIDKTPTEDVKPIVRGEWIRDEFGGFRCSVCEDYNAVNYDRFCNNCGADMRNEREEENDNN